MNNYEALSRLSNIDLQQYGDDTFGDGRLTPLYACDCYREEFVTLLKSIDKLEKYKWHDLRKDPNDLPETFVDVWICFTDYKYCGDEKFYEVAGRREEDWTWSGDEELLNERYQIIAWKYIEDFEDE